MFASELLPDFACDSWVLRRFRRIAKKTVSFVMSVCLPLVMEQLTSRWTDVHEILYLCIFRKAVHKISQE